MRLLAERYPCVNATTDSCAKPVPCARLWLSLVRTLFAGCCQPLLGKGPSRRYLCESFLRAWTPTPAAPVVRVPVTSHETTAFPEL
jgi:hypothetical protein